MKRDGGGASEGETGPMLTLAHVLEDDDFAPLRALLSPLARRPLDQLDDALRAAILKRATEEGVEGLAVVAFFSACDLELRRGTEAKRVCCVSPAGEHPLYCQDCFGTHSISMTVEGVLAYLKGLQSEYRLLERDVIHSEDELALTLCGRDAAVEEMAKVFRTCFANFRERPPPDDRMLYPMAVCCGMKGLGKTRMLEEWRRVFRAAQLPEPWLGVLVTYGNGHSPKDFEHHMPVEAAFSWRMLHRLFLGKGNSKSENPEAAFLPCNAAALNLRVALRVIRAAAGELNLAKENETLSLFIGVDEYQKIPGSLSALVDALSNNRAVNGLETHIGFAGTRWGPLSVGGSSAPAMKRVPLRWLSPAMMEDVIRSDAILSVKLSSPDFRRDLLFLGGVPRPSILFAKGRYTFTEAFAEVTAKWQSKDGVSDSELLLLIANAVVGGELSLEKASGIRRARWGQLCDEGLCAMLESKQLAIPYSLIRLAAIGIDVSMLDATASCLVQNLRYMTDCVDGVMFGNEAWHSWDKFGACFFAMRVNSLLLLGDTCVPFSQLCRGAVVNGCDARVTLAPMEVHEIREELSPRLLASVTKRGSDGRLNWVTGDGGIRYCLLNPAGGKGVDFFSALPLADGSGGLLLYNDQRKVVGAELAFASLLEKANIVPDCLPARSGCVRGLFSLASPFGGSSADIPVDTLVLSHRQRDAFYGNFSAHPACIEHSP
jgi:hypothetical protein